MKSSRSKEVTVGYRYIGAKTRIIDEILLKIKEIVPPGSHVADLMCGTGAVAAALRRNGYKVTANDVMTYSYHHAKVLLLFTSSPSFEKANSFVNRLSPAGRRGLFPPSPYERMLSALNCIPPEKGYFWKEFSIEGSPKNIEKTRNYFSPENAKKIDGIRLTIRRLWENNEISDLEHSLLIHDLIMGVNDIANIAGTYGHHIAKLVGRAKDQLELKPTSLLVLNDAGKHKVLQGYAEDLAKEIKCDLCYIDPPYKKRQYAANYHILETLAREDEPEAIGVSGLRPWRDQYSNFCTKTRIRNSFRKIFSEMKCPHFIISYSEDGLLTIQELHELLEEFGDVQVSTLSNKRFRSNNSSLEPYLTEYLIHLEIR